MPMKSEAQRNLMRAAAHDPKFAKEHRVTQKVANEFVNADTGGKLPTRVPKHATKTKRSRKNSP